MGLPTIQKGRLLKSIVYYFMEQNSSSKHRSTPVRKLSETPTLNSKSWLDSKLGEHTTPVLVTIMFVIVFIGLIIIVCFKEKMPDGLQTGLITLLGTLAGFFAGTKLKKE